MARVQQTYLVFSSLFLLIMSQPLAARPIGMLPLRDGLEVEPILNIALPGGGVDSDLSAHPCNMANNMATRSSTILKKIEGRYSSLVFNVLPRGFIPPSGPSKGINDIKN